jgi:hypothetical protein
VGDSGNALHESVRRTNNEYVREAVQRALEGDIEERVYERIKGDLSRLKFLGGVGAILLLVAGYFHEPIFRFIIDVGGKEFKSGISKDIADEELVSD